MKRLRVGTACCCIAFAVPAMAADAPPAAAAQCLTDLGTFSARLNQAGYWMGGSADGYGYPMGGYGYGDMTGPEDYYSTRSGYDIRTLLSAANILARQGQQATCEAVLAQTATMYAAYAATLHSEGINVHGGPGWQRRQIAGALPVSDATAALRIGQLVDTDVLNPQDVSLGSVHDIVLSPQTGRIAYLIIGRGGIFGFDQSYFPVPWHDFKATANVNLLVLDASEADMSAAPQVSDAQFVTRGAFAAISQRVDSYWLAHLPAKAAE
jgi:sporulation protein YlmC with PRC-barrel domain